MTSLASNSLLYAYLTIHTEDLTSVRTRSCTNVVCIVERRLEVQIRDYGQRWIYLSTVKSRLEQYYRHIGNYIMISSSLNFRDIITYLPKLYE